jgi:hypothetical protein
MENQEVRDRIINYLEKQAEIKTQSIKALDVPIISDEGKREIERESMIIRRELYELQRHIEVIKIL